MSDETKQLLELTQTIRKQSEGMLAQIGQYELEAINQAATITQLQLDKAELAKAYKWWFSCAQDGMEFHNTPDEPVHECEFDTNPEKGACDFCERFHDAINLFYPVDPTLEHTPESEAT